MIVNKSITKNTISDKNVTLLSPILNKVCVNISILISAVYQVLQVHQVYQIEDPRALSAGIKLKSER